MHNREVVTLKEAHQIWTGLRYGRRNGVLTSWASGHTSCFPVQKCLDLSSFISTFWSSQAITSCSIIKVYLKTQEKVSSGSCPYGFSTESIEHVFRECIRYIPGSPMDWEDLTMDHGPHSVHGNRSGHKSKLKVSQSRSIFLIYDLWFELF